MTLQAEHQADRIILRRSGQEAPLLVQQAPSDRRPYIHPLAAPDLDGTLTEDAPPHHPWQHGLYVGLNDVNGHGFWTEGLRGDPQDGSFHPRPLAPPAVLGDRASWTVVCDWRAPDGSALLTEIQAWRLHDRGASIEVDLDWTLIAAVDLRFGHYSYGGLFLRMPYREGGSVLTGSGHDRIATAEGQRAPWVAIAMALPDRQASDAVCGMAIFDHPGNPEHPSPWRVDGQLGIGPGRCIAGPWSLAAGSATTSRYRVLAHCGRSEAAVLDDCHDRFVS